MRLTAAAAPSRLVFFAALERTAASGGPLTLTELQQYMQKPVQFGIVSAYMTGANRKPAPENKRRHGDLIADLQSMGYSPGQIRPLRGQWEREEFPQGDPRRYPPEKSVLVLDMTYQDAQALGAKYGQSAVIWKSKDGLLGMYYGDGRVQLPAQGDRILHGPAAVNARPRGPKDPSGASTRPDDLFSKARGVSFEFPFNWDATWKTDPAKPLTKTEAERLLKAWPYGNADESGKATARRASN